MKPRAAIALLAAIAIVAIAVAYARDRQRLAAQRALESATHTVTRTARRIDAMEAADLRRTAEGRVATLERALLKDETWADGRVALAEAHFELGAKERARSEVSRAIARGAGSHAFYLRGEILLRDGDRRGSQTAFLDAARLAGVGETFYWHAALAAIALDERRNADAEREADKAIAHDGEHPWAYAALVRRAVARARLGKADAAARDQALAISRAPQAAPALAEALQ